ncbi:MAG: sensor histidine kinase, partial [Saprospiraceae bacterium]
HEQEEHMQLLENEQIVQRSWNNRLLFLLLFALLIIAFAIYFLRVRRRLNASLQQKNQLLNQAVQDRELLIREVHHRVKNNLQIITSLLNLQLRHVTHPAARAALTDGRNRVRSISLLHQDLYQESKLKGVDTQIYLTNIVHNLQYAFRDEEVNVQTEIDKIIVDEEQMVLVGLIINEALTNAYKHAFAETKEPKIELTFLAQQEQLNLRIADNGKGFDPATATRQRQSFGLQLIEDMARKLKAKISLQSDIKGTILILEIPNVEPSSQ